jgi:signal transduction histidine kinase
MRGYGLNDDAGREEVSINAENHNEKMAALGQLSGGIAHDYNNHLMSIIGNATMIMKTKDLDKIYDKAQQNLLKKFSCFPRKNPVPPSP